MILALDTMLLQVLKVALARVFFDHYYIGKGKPIFNRIKLHYIESYREVDKG